MTILHYFKRTHSLPTLLSCLLSGVLPGTLAYSMPVYAASEKTDPVALMRQIEQANSPQDEQVSLDMTLIDANGKTSQRKATFYRRQQTPGKPASSKLIRFSSPPELDGSAVLTIENEGSADSQWLYLPVYHTSRKIPPSNKSDRYMGTDFYFEDVSDDKIDQYSYRITGHEDIAGRAYLVIEQKPVNAEASKDSAYSKKIIWADPVNLTVARIHFFGRDGTQIKDYQASGPKKTGEYWRWTEVSMHDIQSGHITTINYTNRQINQKLDRSLFSLRRLEKP